jgi:hypothetical protein
MIMDYNTVFGRSLTGVVASFVVEAAPKRSPFRLRLKSVQGSAQLSIATPGIVGHFLMCLLD